VALSVFGLSFGTPMKVALAVGGGFCVAWWVGFCVRAAFALADSARTAPEISLIAGLER
jgi:hypothetical protein